VNTKRFALVAFVLGSTGLAVALSQRAHATVKPSSLPYYDSRDFTPRWSTVEHRIGSFNLVDQSRRALREKDLEGKIHVASFLFAQCPSLCPTLVHRLKPVQDAIRDQHDVLMVSYSVTPQTDTPDVLREFGRLRGIDPERWRLLTGNLGDVSRVIRDSYFADDDRPIVDGSASRLLHTEKVLLVDRDRHLRGIYNGTNAFEMQRLIEDIATLRQAQ
jgi:protein SCO1/2